MSAVAEACGPGLIQPRPNSFNLVPRSDVPRGRGQKCPLQSAPARLRELLADTTPARAAFLRLADRMRLFTTLTGDFDEQELSRIKRELGQLYADVSSKLAPDDFARDLVKLELAAECSHCEQRDACAGCYLPNRRDVFGRDDARVRELLASLSGSVLDVGCGEGPYLSELEAAARAGRISYLGLEPDAERLAVLQSRHAWAELRVGTLDALEDDRRFDHVLMLRSYNHLPDPRQSLARAVELLVPGGTLLLVDNVAFGLARARGHAVRAEGSAAAFEHFRNDSATEAHALCAVHGLELLERRDVGPATSNQWLLHYRSGNRIS